MVDCIHPDEKMRTDYGEPFIADANQPHRGTSGW